MFLVLATLLEAFVLRDFWAELFLLFACFFVESTSVDLSPWSHHQPPGVSPRLFRLHPATRNQAPGTDPTLKQPALQRSPRTKTAQAPQSLLVVSTGHPFSIT